MIKNVYTSICTKQYVDENNLKRMRVGNIIFDQTRISKIILSAKMYICTISLISKIRLFNSIEICVFFF